MNPFVEALERAEKLLVVEKQEVARLRAENERLEHKISQLYADFDAALKRVGDAFKAIGSTSDGAGG